MLGVFVAGPTVMMSTLTSCGCDDCEAACQNDCEGTCSNLCTNTCSGTCSSSCEGYSTGKSPTGQVNGHEYTDLGLSVLWASCNLGSDSPTEVGNYYPFIYDGYDSKTWYTFFSSANLKSGDTICGGSLDIAKQKWGSKWRLPGYREIKELVDNCETEFFPNVGVKLTSKKNGNSIVMPYKNSKELWWSGDVSTSSTGKIGADVLNIYDEDGKTKVEYDWLVFFYWEYNGDIYSYKHLIRPITDRANGDLATCNGTCTANCSDSCTVTCKNKCNNTCKNSCGNNCIGGCNTTCTTTCADTCKAQTSQNCSNCTSNCSSGCTTTCADSCKAQTSQYCSNCASSCSSGCTTTCADSCKAQTSQGCGGCSNTCSTGCGRQCYNSCGGSCDNTCAGYCITGCSGYSKGSCAGGTCFGTCSTQCSSTCRSFCYSSCTSMGVSGT